MIPVVMSFTTVKTFTLPLSFKNFSIAENGVKHNKSNQSIKYFVLQALHLHSL
jgi:hypothetical protein